MRELLRGFFSVSQVLVLRVLWKRRTLRNSWIADLDTTRLEARVLDTQIRAPHFVWHSLRIVPDIYLKDSHFNNFGFRE
jgi:hypothetical protein